MGFVTWLRDPAVQPRCCPLAPLLYPIQARDPDSVAEAVSVELNRIIGAAIRSGQPWDITLRHVSEALRMIKKREQIRARRAVKKWERKLRSRVKTREELIEYEQGRLARQMERRHGARLLLVTDAAAILAHRLSQRAPRLLSSIDGAEQLSIADKFATKWAPLLTNRHATCSPADTHRRLTQLCAIPKRHVLESSDNDALMAAVTSDEVVQTIKDLGAHKAGGADRLNNDFYRDWAEILAPALAQEYNRILSGDAMPDSFGEAVIVPLPKNGNSSNPMDYRPISLLQSSYKILTKLLARRVQSSLGRVINADQNGFVRGRDMANNIILMQSILAQDYDSDDGSAAASPVAVLLDFKKAYDTLDRGFLTAALTMFGYSPSFVALVERLHAGTTARFLANGDLSVPLNVQTGIRQGCPLAPLLFLLAAETLKYAVAQTPGIRGITLSSAGVCFQHSFSAFVDDSVVFVAEGAMLTGVEETLRVFAELSGLQVQPTKSHAIVLNRSCAATAIGAFPVVPSGETVTYLGTEIGLEESSPANWEKRITKLERSLGAASRFTTSLYDRVTILNTVGLPSVLFTSKYATPSPQILQTLDAIWRQYLWNGTVSSAPIRAHKLAQPILSLPRDDLGLGLRDMREAMVEQAARTVLQWNARPRDKYWAALHNILQAAIPGDAPVLHCYPSQHASTVLSTVDGKLPLLRVGWIRVNASLAGRYPVPAAVNALKSETLTTSRGATAGLWWTSSTSGRFTLPATLGVDWTHVTSVVYSAMPHEIRSFWTTFPWADNTWIVGDDGKVLTPKDFPCIAIKTIGGLQLQHAGDRCFTFHNPCVQDPFRLRQTQREQLTRWLQIMIVNSGFHCADPLSRSPDRVYSMNAHPTFDRYEWQLAPASEHAQHLLRGQPLLEKWRGVTALVHGPGLISAEVQAWGQTVAFLDAQGAAEVHKDLQALQDDVHGAVILAGHPRLHHGPTLLTPKTRYKEHSLPKELRSGLAFALCVKRRRERALRLLIDRLERSHLRDPELQTALRSRTIQALHTRAEGETAYQAIFRYRLTIGALNLRSNTGERLACPHDWCPGTSATTNLTHVIWTCEAATRTWQLVHRQWTQRPLGDWHAGFLGTCFGVEVPVLARAIRQELPAEANDLTVLATAPVTAWRMIQAIVPHQLWLHRNAAAFQGAEESVHSVAAKVWAAITRQVDALAAAQRLKGPTYALGWALGALMRMLNADSVVHVRDAHQVRLYYDGGARGNPGCCGAGSLLVERRPAEEEWTIVWWTATYLGEAGTNNVAEHMALAQGLEEAARRYSTRNVAITAVGDSMLATRQLLSQVRVTSPKLAGPYDRSRAALRHLYDYEFQHTLRTGNTAADWLANAAMNSKTHQRSDTSSLTTYASTMTAIEPLIRNDTAHAWSTTLPHGLVHQLRTRVSEELSPNTTTRKRPRPIPMRPPIAPHQPHVPPR